MILAHGGIACFFAVGLLLPPLAYLLGCALRGRRFAESVWLYVAALFAGAFLILVVLIGTLESGRTIRHRTLAGQVLDVIAMGMPMLSVSGVPVAVVMLFAVAAMRRRFAAGHCQQCGYNLTGNMSGRCPECGRYVTPPSDDAECSRATEQTGAQIRVSRILARGSLLVLATGLVLVGAVAADRLIHRPQPFNSDGWLAMPKKNRTRMADGIAQSGVLNGRAHDEVIKLLGSPDEEVLAYNVGTGYNRISMYLDHQTGQITFAGFSLRESPPAEPFDRERWRSMRREGRWPMAVSLQRDNILRGKGRAEIIELLGVPDNEDSMRYNCSHVNDALIVSLRDGRVFQTFHLDQ